MTHKTTTYKSFPLSYQIFIKEEEPKQPQSKGGILLVEGKTLPTTAVIVAIGSHQPLPNTPTPNKLIQVGVRVEFKKHSGQTVRTEQYGDVLMVSESDLLAVHIPTEG